MKLNSPLTRGIAFGTCHENSEESALECVYYRFSSSQSNSLADKDAGHLPGNAAAPGRWLQKTRIPSDRQAPQKGHATGCIHRQHHPLKAIWQLIFDTMCLLK